MTAEGLEAEMKELGVSVPELARVARVSRETIRRMLTGVNADGPRARTVRRIAEAIESLRRGEKPIDRKRAEVLRLFDEAPEPIQDWVIATLRVGIAGFVPAHDGGRAATA